MMMMTILICLTISLCAMLLVSGIIIRNLSIQNSKYQKAVEDVFDEYLSNLNEIQSEVQYSLDVMRELDQREAFEKDDEVGVVFVQIKECIEKLKNKLSEYEETKEDN